MQFLCKIAFCECRCDGSWRTRKKGRSWSWLVFLLIDNGLLVVGSETTCKGASIVNGSCWTCSEFESPYFWYVGVHDLLLLLVVSWSFWEIIWLFFVFYFGVFFVILMTFRTLLVAHRTASLRRDVDSEVSFSHYVWFYTCSPSWLICYWEITWIAIFLIKPINSWLKLSFLKLREITKLLVTCFTRVRFKYYFLLLNNLSGRIKATQLDYTSAYKNLTQAIRKAPQNSAAGFQQTAHKFLIIVQLLMGEIPERSLFRKNMLAKALIPYFNVCQVVRVGDVSKFQQVLEKYGAQFKKDKTFTLILRYHSDINEMILY